MSKFYGVNLGGWLIVEKWITPSLFAGLDATDEYTLCLSEEGRHRLLDHRNKFITADDFKWLAANQVNSIRIPVGYWLYEDDEPYISSKDYFDFALDQAEKVGLGVVIDLHGAPGSQNGNDHSGKRGDRLWQDKTNRIRTLAVLERIAADYGQRDCVVGIEVMNEPDWEIGGRKLKSFYKKAYKTIRKHSDVDVIVSDSFRPDKWRNVLPEKKYPGLLFDLHLYQVFSEEDRNLSLEGHISKAKSEWRDLIRDLQSYNRVMIGEWSIEMQSKPELFLKNDQSCRAYAEAQIESFNQAYSWYFWTLKTENRRYWDFRECIKRGLIKL